MNKQNPENSSTVQMFIDLRRTFLDDETMNDSARDELIKELDKLKSMIPRHCILRNDKLFNSHQYPDYALSYSKAMRDVIPFDLSASACKIMLITERVFSSDSMILLNTKTTPDRFKMNRKTFMKALEELQDYGYIKKIFQSRSGTISGSIFSINPKFVDVGKGNEWLYKRITSKDEQDAFEESVTSLEVSSLKMNIPDTDIEIKVNYFVDDMISESEKNINEKRSDIRAVV